MKLEEQVVSLELAKRISKLGVKRISLYVYYDKHTDEEGTHFKLGTWNEPAPHYVVYPDAGIYGAFTVAELGEMLPEEIPDEPEGTWHHLRTYPVGAHWACAYVYHNGEDGTWSTTYVEKARNEADARAKMLIYLIENNLITV